MKEYDIRDFGAAPGDIPMTGKIQRAIDAAGKDGGTVVVPAGVYYTGGLYLHSGVTLLLKTGAMLCGVRDPEAYFGYRKYRPEPAEKHLPKDSPVCHSASTDPYSRWCNGLLRAIGEKNIAVIGEPGSFFCGNNVYDPEGEENYRGPHLMSFWNCEGIRLEGYAIRDSSNWAHAIFHSTDIWVEGISVYGGHDGFDVRSCDRVSLKNCSFFTGDDCVAGFDNKDVTVRDCFFNTACSAIRFGGTDVLFENCVTRAPAGFGFRGHMPGARRKEGAEAGAGCGHYTITGFLYYCDFREIIRYTPGNILIRNCVFDGIDNLFRMPYDRHRWCCNRPLTSITFENCTVTGTVQPMEIIGSEKEPLTITFRDCRMSPRKGFEYHDLLFAENCEKILLERTELTGFTDPTAALMNNAVMECRDSTVPARKTVDR